MVGLITGVFIGGLWFYMVHKLILKKEYHEYVKSSLVQFWRRFKFSDNMTKFDIKERKFSDVAMDTLEQTCEDSTSSTSPNKL